MDKNTESKSFPVPKGRIRRASSFGKIAIKFASSIVLDGTKELVGGRSPALKNLLFQEKNISNVVEIGAGLGRDSIFFGKNLI